MKILRLEDVNAENIQTLHWDPLTPEELKDAYVLARATSKPEDWDGVDLNDTVSMDEFLDELEKDQKQIDANRNA